MAAITNPGGFDVTLTWTQQLAEAVRRREDAIDAQLEAEQYAADGRRRPVPVREQSGGRLVARPVRAREAAPVPAGHRVATSSPPDFRQGMREAFRRLGLSEQAARTAARGRDRAREAAAAKDTDGRPAAAYAWTPDPSDSQTWRWPLTDVHGEYSAPLIDAAIVAFPSASVPESDRAEVASRLRKAWAAVYPDADLPAGFDTAAGTTESLGLQFERLGLSSREAAIAARGR
jgi:hypothetical protein